MATLWEVRYIDPTDEQEHLFEQRDIDTAQGVEDLIADIRAAHATGATVASVNRELSLEG